MTVGVVIAIVALVGVIGFAIWDLKNRIQSPEENSKASANPNTVDAMRNAQPSKNISIMDKTRRPSSHRWLCYAFYVLGWLLLASWLRFWLFVTDGSDSANVSSVVTLISSLGLLAVGRLIEVLQNIDDELYRKRMRGSS